MVVVTQTGAGGAGGTGGASGAAEGATDRSGLTLETIVALFAAGQATALLLEVGHAHGREGGGGVVLGLVLVDLVDGDGGVDDRRLDGLLLDDGLDGPDAVSTTSTSTTARRTHS